MATIFGSSSIFLLPHTRTSHHITSSSATPPPQQPQPSGPSSPQSTTNLNEDQSVQVSAKAQQQIPIKPVVSSTKVDSTDWIATSLTRRFGLGAGLAWVGFLAFGVVSEQIKTRLEVSQQEYNTRNVEEEKEVILPNGIRYYELKIGGGDMPRRGDLVVIDIMGKVESTGEVFVNTFEGDKKPLALVMGSRPYSKGVCEGIEYVLKTMKAGGKRKVIVPPELGFRENGADLGSGVEIPPLATLEYVVQVDKVSIAPA